MDTLTTTSSPELPDGPKPSTLPAGIETDLFGQPLSPASPFPSPASSEGRQMTATSGLHSSGSSASIALSASLASRLLKRLDSIGSMEYRQIWRQKATRSGRTYWEHTASARPIGDNGSTGWPTPRTPTGGAESAERKQELGRTASGGGDLASVALMAPWPTPCAKDERGNHSDSWAQVVKETRAPASPWATPRAEDAESSGMRHSRGVADTLTAQTTLAGWVSPTAQDGSRGDKPPRPQDTGVPLSQQVVMAGWTTPQAHDSTGRSETQKEKHGTKHGCACLGLDAQKASGTTSPSSHAGTENIEGSKAEPSPSSRGALNPAHSRWLQGFPVAWCQAAIRASRKLKPARKRG